MNSEEISYLDEKCEPGIYFLEGSSLIFSSIVLSEGEEGVPCSFYPEDSRCLAEGCECIFSFDWSEFLLFYSTSTVRYSY